MQSSTTPIWRTLMFLQHFTILVCFHKSMLSNVSFVLLLLQFCSNLQSKFDDPSKYKSLIFFGNCIDIIPFGVVVIFTSVGIVYVNFGIHGPPTFVTYTFHSFVLVLLRNLIYFNGTYCRSYFNLLDDLKIFFWRIGEEILFFT